MAPADALAERMLRRFPSGPSYTAEVLRQGGLPRALAHFIEQALQRRLAMERETLEAARDSARSPWFDPSDPAAEQAWQQYIDALGATARVPADEWPHALRQAARQVTAYLLRPAAALVGFVFADEQGSLPAGLVLRRMRYFAAYPYLHDVVHAYVRDKGLDTIDRKGFASLLQRLEAHAAERYQGDAWGALLDDLFDTLGEGTPPAISAALLAPLFADKGLSDLAQRLASTPAPITREALVRLLGGAAPDAAADVAADVAAAHVSPPASEPFAPEVQRTVAREADAAAPWPVAPRTPEPPAAPAPVAPARPATLTPDLPAERQRATPPVAPAVSAPNPSDAASSPPQPEDRRPLWQRVMGGRREGGDGLNADLAALEARALGPVTPVQRQTFVRQLFGGDARAYADALQRLSAAASWTEAARLLLALFEARGVDLYAPAAIALTDAAEQRFL